MFFDFIHSLVKFLGSESALLQSRAYKKSSFLEITKGEVTESTKRKGNKSYDFIFIDGHHHLAKRNEIISPVLSFESDSEGNLKGSPYQAVSLTKSVLMQLLTYGKTIEFNKKKYEISPGFATILEYLELLKDGGYLLICCEEGDLIKEQKMEFILEDMLNERGFSINAVIGFPHDRNDPFYYRKHHCFYIISEKSNGDLFIADIRGDGSNIATISENVAKSNLSPANLQQGSQSIDEGYFIDREKFYSLRQERAKSKK